MIKLKLIAVILLIVLAIGGTIILLGFLTSQEYIDVPEISNQYEKLDIYKNELEKINQNNQQLLKDLENKIQNPDNVHLDQINAEIKMAKQVIEENTAELEQVITKLSQMESDP